ncbi:MAG: hypothetical protein AAF950_17605, partial [Pseudomonadota bacterium]
MTAKALVATIGDPDHRQFDCVSLLSSPEFSNCLSNFHLLSLVESDPLKFLTRYVEDEWDRSACGRRCRTAL